MPDAATALGNIGMRGETATALAEELAPDEQPLGAIKATAEDDLTAGTLLLTDRRLVFFNEGHARTAANRCDWRTFKRSIAR